MKKIILSALSLMSAGTMMAQFTAYDNNGNVLFEMKDTRPSYIEFSVAPETENGHKYVDLLLPSTNLWATCNVGANSPEEFGDYYAWGETIAKSVYDKNTYVDKGYVKYNSDRKKTLDNQDDVAVMKWGGKWRVPSAEDLQELIEHCVWVSTSSYKGKDVKGFIVFRAKKKADKGTVSSEKLDNYDEAKDDHIFLPWAGYVDGKDTLNAGKVGAYISRDMGEDGESAHLLNVGKNVNLIEFTREFGYSVRPVISFE